MVIVLLCVVGKIKIGVLLFMFKICMVILVCVVWGGILWFFVIILNIYVEWFFLFKLFMVIIELLENILNGRFGFEWGFMENDIWLFFLLLLLCINNILIVILCLKFLGILKFKLLFINFGVLLFRFVIWMIIFVDLVLGFVFWFIVYIVSLNLFSFFLFIWKYILISLVLGLIWKFWLDDCKLYWIFELILKFLLDVDICMIWFLILLFLVFWILYIFWLKIGLLLFLLFRCILKVVDIFNLGWFLFL